MQFTSTQKRTAESFYLTPQLAGERIGLHPLVVIFALLSFGQLSGFVGMLIAWLASAMLLVMRRAQAQAHDLPANFIRVEGGA